MLILLIIVHQEFKYRFVVEIDQNFLAQANIINKYSFGRPGWFFISIVFAVFCADPGVDKGLGG